ncbi:programmed cell death protein 2-like [Mercenaria mercenaria]|uniref:programmed cell death protein 2-like n=1 Tax=Mercenaria mercenaria TaxID=6596 RepID=UPI00234E7993|nr:programmed cell death protein 2-like [Mercenaria mercenaria]
MLMCNDSGQYAHVTTTHVCILCYALLTVQLLLRVSRLRNKILAFEEKMTCLLGVCDTKIPSNYSPSSHTNKIGGTPNWPDNVQMSIPSCQVCKKEQFLVVQLYCCLEKSIYHRTLYVFACGNPACWNNEQSWTVYRCQSADSNQLESPSQSVPKDNLESGNKSASHDWGVDADDWGVDADDWGEDADDLGVDADDWGNSSGGADVQTNDADVDEHLGSISSEGSAIPQDNDGRKKCRPDVDADCVDMKQLCLDDVTDDATNDVTDDDMAEDKPSNPSHVLAEDMPSLSEQEKLNLLHTFNASSSNNNAADKVLESSFINVFEEPCGLVEDNHHVAKLIKDYQKREGCNLKEMLNDLNCVGGSKTENYEKTALLHRDFMFHKFIKRLSACPEQCIRYEWNGSALLNSYPSSKLPSTCCHCGGEVVFELQLTPALINHLRLPGQTGSAVEFGTVLVYTCKQSCWDESDSYRTEYAVVQTDPDQHLFKNN